MKKILLILLCMPLIGVGQENENCNSKPDYIMSSVDFIRTIKNMMVRFFRFLTLKKIELVQLEE